MRFDPYAKRDHETYRAWCERILSCPIIGPQPIKEIAELTGADISSLHMYSSLMRKSGWQPPTMLHLTAPRSNHQIDDAFKALEGEDADEYF